MKPRLFTRRRAARHPRRRLRFEAFEPRRLLASEFGELFGAVWKDANGDGERQADEPRLPEWRVFLDDDGDNHWDDGERSTLTNGEGFYHLEEVSPGDHLVALVLLQGWTLTAPADGAYSVHVEAGQAREGLRFGVDPPEAGLLAGVVWNDLDGDGQHQDGEPPLADWPVYLDLSMDSNGGVNEPGQVAWTDDFGHYRFEVLPGDHDITVGLEEGWSITAPEAGAYHVSLEANEAVDGLRFGLLGPEFGHLVGSVWNDLNGDGVRQEVEPPLADWPVFLDGQNVIIFDPANHPDILPGDQKIAWTNDDGVYHFEKAIVGHHTVTVGLGDGWTVTAPMGGAYEVDVAADQIIEGLAFGLKAPEFGQVVGAVWNDLNGDGLRQEEEPPLADWPVFLDEQDIMLLDPASAGILPSDVVLTDDHGAYRFEHVLVGEHVISVLEGDGWTATAPQGGEQSVTVEADQVVEGVNFGLPGPELGQLVGSVWSDLNGDGQRQDEEPPLVGWVVYLDDISLGPAGDPNSPFPNPLDLAVTDEHGVYRFQNILAGDHAVTLAPEDEWILTAPAEGFYNVTLGGNQTIDGLRFGVQHTEAPAAAWILGAAWNDLNGDGVWGQDEPPLVEWQVFLDGNGNGKHDDGEPSDGTSIHGGYAIRVEGDQTYQVTLALREDWSATAPEAGAQEVHVAPGEVVDGVRFGAQLLATAEGPLARSDHAATAQDLPVEIAVLENDEPGPEAAWNPDTLIVVEAPEHGSVHISLPLGVVTYVPDPGYFGQDRFTYTVATDGGAVSNEAAVEIEVGLREHPWQNPRRRCDVDDSGDVSLADLVTALTDMRDDGPRGLPMPDPSHANQAPEYGDYSSQMFFDVNGDDTLTLNDLLDIVAELRDALAAATAAESEADAATTAAPLALFGVAPESSSTASIDEAPSLGAPPSGLTQGGPTENEATAVADPAESPSGTCSHENDKDWFTLVDAVAADVLLHASV